MSEPVVERLLREWTEFREINDRRLSEIEQHGAASAETTAHVDRLNASISDLQAQVRDLETIAHRPAGAPSGRLSDERLNLYAAWQSEVTGKPVTPGSVDVELVENYSAAFRAYMRAGDRTDPAHLRILNDLSVGSDADGGYWVSPDTSGRAAELIYESSPVRQVAAAQPISTDALEGDLDLDEAEDGWVGETEARPDTATPQIGQWRIAVHEQYAQPKATQKLLDDARVNVEAWLAAKVARRFARSESTAFVSGDGVKRPRGFLTYAAGTPSASTWNVIQQVNLGHASDITSADSPNRLIDLVYSLKSSYRSGSIWGMQRLTEAKIRKLADGDGNYLWQPDYSRLGQATLLGFPVVEMADMPAVEANALAVVFGNFQEAYQIVDRMGIRVLRDPYTSKGWVKFYTTRRLGGGVVNFEALKIGKIAT